MRSETINWVRAAAYAYHGLGDVALLEGDTEKSHQCYQKAWTMAQPWNDLRLMAHLQLSETRLTEAMGQGKQALALAKIALKHFHGLNMRREKAETAALIARLEEAIDQQKASNE